MSTTRKQTMAELASVRLLPGMATYPASLRVHLGEKAPAAVAALGSVDILSKPLLGLFCSVRCPGDLILRTYDLARQLREAGVPVIGGFHSPMEKECLALLLRGSQLVVICPARSLDGMRMAREWRQPIAEGRLLLLSPFPAKSRRVTADLAAMRNEFVAALASRVFIAHAEPGGSAAALAEKVRQWGKPVLNFEKDITLELKKHP